MCTGIWRRCWRPAARASTRITIVRTIPMARCRIRAIACDCRKPSRGLVERAVSELGIDPGVLVRGRRPLARCGAGAAVGARAAVRTGYGATEEA